jgi:hypothetical protein
MKLDMMQDLVHPFSVLSGQTVENLLYSSSFGGYVLMIDMFSCYATSFAAPFA